MNQLDDNVINDSNIIDMNKIYGSQMDSKSQLFILQMLSKTEIERKELELQIKNDIKTEEEKNIKIVKDAENALKRIYKIGTVIGCIVIPTIIIVIVLESLSII